MIRCTLTALCLGFASAQIPAGLRMNRVEVRNAASRNALCNNGKPAAYYYRNCSANWDRKPGFPDYCAEVPFQRWIIIFEGSYRDACYSPETCAAVSNSSRAPPIDESVFPSGALLPYAEANPNLYKSYTAYVPQCSSDLWTGNASLDGASEQQGALHFRGRAIAKAILEDLRAGEMQGGGSLANAQAVTLVIPTGLAVADGSPTSPSGSGSGFQGLQTLADWTLAAPALSNFSRANITAVCDGCLLTSFGRAPLANFTTLSPGLVPADTLLKRALPIWTAVDSHATSAASVDAFRPEAAIKSMAAASPVQVLVQSQLADAQQLEALAAWPPPQATSSRLGYRLSTSWSTYALEFAAAVVQILQFANSNNLYTFGAACAQPSSMLANSSFLYTDVPHVVQPGVPPVLDPLRTALPSFLANVLLNQPRSAFGQYIDNCSSVPGATDPLCNPSHCQV